MTHHIFEVENIKCGGCMSTIRKSIEGLTGVQQATPDNENGTVAVDFDDTLVSTDQIAFQLAKLGYPLKGQNGITEKAKSYVSCMIGRINGDQ